MALTSEGDVSCSTQDFSLESNRVGCFVSGSSSGMEKVDTEDENTGNLTLDRRKGSEGAWFAAAAEVGFSGEEDTGAVSSTGGAVRVA